MEVIEQRGRRLSRARALALQHAYRSAGDLDARERLIEAYLPLVRSLARQFANRGEGLDDLVQVGSIGLIKAVDRFDPRRGVDLAAFAMPNIVGEIKRHLRDRSEAIRVPRREQEVSARLRDARRRLVTRLHRNPTHCELAAEAQLDERELAEAFRVERTRARLSLAEGAPAVSAEEVFDHTEDRVAVSSGLRLLHSREREVIRCRFYGDMSQGEIAARLGISQTQASRLLASGLAKLRTDFDVRADFSPSRQLNSWHGDSRRRHGRAA